MKQTKLNMPTAVRASIRTVARGLPFPRKNSRTAAAIIAAIHTPMRGVSFTSYCPDIWNPSRMRKRSDQTMGSSRNMTLK